MAESAVAGEIDAGSAAVALLGELISLDTVNPPGNEEIAQELLASRLSDAGFSCELLAAEPGRPNLIARLAGQRPGKTLCLLSHVDVVPFTASDWSFDPLSGAVREGAADRVGAEAGAEVLGRGAQDMKSQVAAEVAAACALGDSGWRPDSGELIVVVTADEEMGAHAGAKWLCEEHPEKVRCDWVVNEGAGIVVELGERRAYTVCIGEKGVFRFNLRTHGRAGHGSMPRIGDNALLKLAPLITALAEQPAVEGDADALAFVGALLGESVDAGGLAEAVSRIAVIDPIAAGVLVEPMLGVSVAPTRVRASEKDNVIPALAEALVDCRVPPGLEGTHVRARIGELLGDGDYEIEFADEVVGNRSSPEGPLYEAIGAWVAGAEPDAVLAPMVMPGFSDSHWFRKELGAVAFGFCPQRSMTLAEALPLIHGADERIKVADVELAADFFVDIPQRMLNHGAADQSAG